MEKVGLMLLMFLSIKIILKWFVSVLFQNSQVEIALFYVTELKLKQVKSK
jgi:hypothetical protein